jgi:bilin biosynthesis protein
MEREENIERLIQTLKDDDELVQTQAVGLLEEIGEPAVELLLVSAGDKDKEIRKGSIRVLRNPR